jgi:hypothetical protein
MPSEVVLKVVEASVLGRESYLVTGQEAVSKALCL